MLNYLKYTFICISILCGTGFAQTPNIVEGEIIVMLEKSSSVKNFCQKINAGNAGLDLKIKEPISKRINVWLLNYNSSNYSSAQALELLYSKREINLAQFNHTNLELRGDTCPTDPLFSSRQWNMNNTGQNSGTAGADIEACKAWGLTTNTTTAAGDTLVIAVIDDGFYTPHEDLNFFRNRNEIPFNGIDDDGNGYTDDTLGWNTYIDSNRITYGNHGTAVAGIIGAKANNGLGVAGVNWGMQVMPIQGSSSLESTVLKSYGYVLEMRALYDSTNGAKGAYVVATNSSFGINNANAASFPLWCAFYDSLGSYGILSVAAGPNANTNVDTDGDMPTTCISDYLITVTSTTRNDLKVSGAGYGAIHMDIGAPGNAIRSTFSNNSYGNDFGTSFATPHVAGAVGFMYAVACTDFMNLYHTNPDSIALVVKDAILSRSDSNASLLGLTTSGKRLNLYKPALHIISNTPCSALSIEDEARDLSSLSIFPNPNNGIFNLRLDNFEKGVYSYYIVDVAGKLIENKEIKINNNQELIRVKTTNLDKGVYFLCL
ncbi:MAG: S8/S53 family peptidase, partial [Flavobacteriales bacterium]